MTNYEKFKKIIEEHWNDREEISVINGEPRRCSEGSDNWCQMCQFNSSSNCSIALQRWLVSEYKKPEVDWSKVPVDTPILVSNFSEDSPIHRRYFAGIVDGKICAYHTGCTSWSGENQNVTPWGYAKLARKEDMVKYCR